MDFKDKLLDFIDNYANPFFIGSLITNEIIYTNKSAIKFWGMTIENKDFSKIFQQLETKIGDIIDESLKIENTCLVYDFFVTQSDGRKILVDMQLGFFDNLKKEIFFEIIPHEQSVEKSTLLRVMQSARAAAILELDEKLTLKHGNYKFYLLFGGENYESMHQFNQAIGHAFVDNQKKEWIKEIHQGLQNANHYYIEVEVVTIQGEKKWISLELEKKDFGEKPQKLLCFFEDINEKIKHKEEVSLLNQDTQEVKEELSTLNQFFTAMQELDKDVVYRIEVPTMTLYFKKKLADGTWEEVIIPDYFHTFQNNETVHPDDRERYVQMVQDWFDNKIKESEFQCAARFALVTPDYVWYDIKGTKIFDCYGNCIEVYGKLINIDKEKNLETEYSYVKQYLSAAQDLSPNKLFHIDIATKTFYHTDQKDKAVGRACEIPNFVERLIEKNIIHPDYVEGFRKDAYDLLLGKKWSIKYYL